MVSEVLIELGLPGIYLQEHTISWLVNPLTSRELRLDAYFPKVNMAFEYQSKFHFRNAVVPGHDLENTTYMDYVKRQRLKEHGVHLLEVAFFEKFTKEAIKEKLMTLLSLEVLDAAA